jgi:hypothetical protein
MKFRELLLIYEDVFNYKDIVKKELEYVYGFKEYEVVKL